jgi:putative membrane protein insertion efficiency factor
MNLLQHSLIFAIRIYRWTVSPAQIFLFGSNAGCRFTPTCSQYAMDVLREQGVFPGAFTAVGRICRCHPWGECGHDPVPPGGSKIQNPKFKTRGPAR